MQGHYKCYSVQRLLQFLITENILLKKYTCKLYISQHIKLQRHTGYTERSGNTFIPLCTLFCGLFASEQDAGNDGHTCSYCRGRMKNDGKLYTFVDAMESHRKLCTAVGSIAADTVERLVVKMVGFCMMVTVIQCLVS